MGSEMCIRDRRVALLVLALVLVALWRPGSRLWKVPLDTSSVRQRVALGVLLAIPGVATAAVVVWQLVSAVPLSFHTDGMYTYDYDQYDHVARACLMVMRGLIWMCPRGCVMRIIRMMW